MIKKHIYVLITLMILMSGCHHQKQALNHISPKKHELEQWLKYRPTLQLVDSTQQIEAYAVEQYLLSKYALIDPIIRKKLYFLHQNVRNAQAIPLIKNSIKAQLTLPEDEIQESIALLKARQNNQKSKMRLYQIYKQYPNGASQNQRDHINQKMHNIRDQITDLNIFKKLAQQESESQSRLQSGLIGNVADGQFPANINALITDLKANEMSEVIIGKQGAVLFYCERIIPPRPPQSLEHIRQRVINTLSNHTTSQKFNKQKQLLLRNAKIVIDWQAIDDERLEEISVTGEGQMTLNNQQLLWLINGLKGHKTLSETSQQSLISRINDYVINERLFALLSHKQQQQLNEQNQWALKQVLASEVMATLVNKQLSAPTESDEKTHYYANQHLFVRGLHYHISAIALPLDEKHLVQSHQKARELWENLQQQQLSFEQAFHQHSLFKDRYPNGYTVESLTQEIASLFGIDAMRQIQLMQTGQISLPVAASDRGLIWIFRLDKIEPKRPMNFAEAQQAINQYLGSVDSKNLQQSITENIINQMVIDTSEL